MEVANAPIKRSHKAKELHPDDVKTSQLPDVDLGIPGEDVFVRPDPPVIEPVETLHHDPYLAELAFNEEPVTIRAEMGTGQDAPLHIMASVNGKGAEVYIEGLGWVEAKWIPVGQPVIVKRKYLAVWLSSKIMTILLSPDRADGSVPRNLVRKPLSQAYVISIVKDTPQGMEWASRLINQAA